MKKVLLIILLLFLIKLITPTFTRAQGTYTCKWFPILGQFGMDEPKCGPALTLRNPCDDGYIPGADCAAYSDDQDTCEKMSFVCEPESILYECGGEFEKCCVGPGQPRCDNDLVCDSGLCVEYLITTSKGPLGSGDCKGQELDTAIGCIPVKDTTEFVGFILRWAIGIGGGIAFLLIIFAGFQIMTSAGNPERLQAGRELLTSAIAGLILLVFSVFILRIIGVDILNLPGFGG